MGGLVTRQGPRRMWRGLREHADLSFINLLFLCVLTIVFLFLGFSLRPFASEPAQLPNPPALTIDFNGSQPPQDLSIYSYLVQTSSSEAQLIINATGTFKPKQTTIPWTIDIQDFTGYPCTPKQYRARFIPLPVRYDYEISGTSRAVTTPGDPFLVVFLCWNNSPPLTVSGSYVSAALPPVLASPQGGTLTRGLKLSGSSLSTYTLTGGIAPTKVTPQSWAWTSTLSDSQESQASTEIPVVGSSIPGIQRDNRNAFYSGILFGIAGGAAVAVVPALLDMIGKRKDKHKAPAGGDTGPPGEQPPVFQCDEAPRPRNPDRPYS